MNSSSGAPKRVLFLCTGNSAQRGLEVVYLLTTTAAQFFVRVGFVFADRPSPPAEIARSPEFAHACPASAACLKLVLVGAGPLSLDARVSRSSPRDG
jgi:amino-acid N-acetyltransferase